MKVVENCFKNIHINDDVILLGDREITIAGTPARGHVAMDGERMIIFGGIPFKNTAAYIPLDGSLAKIPLDWSALRTFSTLSTLLADWMETVGYVEKVCFDNRKISVTFDDKAQLDGYYLPTMYNLEFSYKGENIEFAFIDNGVFYEVSPFGKKVPPVINTGLMNGYLPIPAFKVFGTGQTLIFSKFVKKLASYDGKNWPGTNVPILMRNVGDASFMASEKGVWYEKNGEIMSTIFVSPIKPTSYFENDFFVTYKYKDFMLHIDKNPAPSQFLSNILSAEVLASTGDIFQEFGVF